MRLDTLALIITILLSVSSCIKREPPKPYYFLTAIDQTVLCEPVKGADPSELLPAETAIKFIDYREIDSEHWVCVGSADERQGWINVSNLSVDNNQYYTQAAIEAVENRTFDTIDNSYIYAKAIELSMIGEYDEVQRKGPLLLIKMTIGTKVFVDSFEETPRGVWYSFSGMHNGKNLIIHLQYYEGTNYLLVNTVSGDQIRTVSIPKFDQQGRYILSAGTTYMEPATVQIIRLTDNNEYVTEFEKELDIQWLVHEYQWTNELEARVSFPPAAERGHLIVRKVAGIWQLSEE